MRARITLSYCNIYKRAQYPSFSTVISKLTVTPNRVPSCSLNRLSFLLPALQPPLHIPTSGVSGLTVSTKETVETTMFVVRTIVLHYDTEFLQIRSPPNNNPVKDLKSSAMACNVNNRGMYNVMGIILSYQANCFN